jgi:fumarylacetoacetate (FAA) hydrolase family protein
MKRILVLLSTSLFCVILTGCSSDPRGDAIKGVVNLMNGAAGDVKSITTAVDSAVEKHKKENTPLDLSEAITAAKGLAARGKELQEIKVSQIDHFKPATEDEKAELAEKYRVRINTAVVDLVKEKTELNKVLQKAEAIDKDKVEELRTKIREAEGPFEALARQQG